MINVGQKYLILELGQGGGLPPGTLTLIDSDLFDMIDSDADQLIEEN